MKYSELIAQMTLEEKASLMSGENFWNTKELKCLGIPSMMLTDGPHGLRKQGGKADHLGLNKSLPATCFPTAATLANSWDVDLLEKTGMYLGKEAVAEDVSVLLGPGLNIKRNPLCGRNFEYFSEDPFLSGKLASAMVVGIQSEGISACPKHRESIYVGYRYYDTINKNVLFPFGFGLSYTSFEYSNISVSDDMVKITLRNTGLVAGAEIAQVYVTKKRVKFFVLKKS